MCLEAWVLFCLVWSLGCNTDFNGRVQISAFLAGLIGAEGVRLPHLCVSTGDYSQAKSDAFEDPLPVAIHICIPFIPVSHPIL